MRNKFIKREGKREVKEGKEGTKEGKGGRKGKEEGSCLYLGEHIY